MCKGLFLEGVKMDKKANYVMVNFTSCVCALCRVMHSMHVQLLRVHQPHASLAFLFVLMQQKASLFSLGEDASVGSLSHDLCLFCVLPINLYIVRTFMIHQSSRKYISVS